MKTFTKTFGLLVLSTFLFSFSTQIAPQPTTPPPTDTDLIASFESMEAYEELADDTKRRE